MATMTEPIPGKLSDKVSFRPRYGNYIGGKWVEPASGQYFENVTPITGKTFCEIPRSNAQDIERALDAAHAARESWGHTSPTHRAILMNKIAQRMEDNLDILALAETWDNGKPIRETVNADLPLAIDHWRYFAGCIRAQEGTISEIDHDTVAYHFHEPLGVVGQIIPWNFPILMATWKLAPAIAAGNCVVLKPAEQTPCQHSGMGRTCCRPPASRRAQYRQRLRTRSRQAAGIKLAGGENSVHRRNHHRPAHHAVRKPESDPRHA